MLKKSLIAFFLLSNISLSWSQNETCKNCDKVLLTENDLVNAENWSVMRNEIFAKHGFIFSNKNFTNYFQSAGWGYKPTKKEVTKEFNVIEKQNIAFLQRHEKNGFSGFDAFVVEFRAAVLANNRSKILEMSDKDVFVINPKNGRDDYETTFDPSVRKAFEKKLWQKSVSEKNTLLDGAKSCGRQFYFTKKQVNGKLKWLLVSVVAPG